MHLFDQKHSKIYCETTF